MGTITFIGTNRVYTLSEDADNNCWRVAKIKTDPLGYVRITINGKGCSFHRLIYEKFKGRIPDGLIIRHMCDNRWCVNPDHLLVGTHNDNVQDRVSRGRSASGTKQHLAKLTDDLVRQIRASSKSTKQIARELKMSDLAISFARKGKTWKHVK